jgi:hypothetical protein
VSDDLKPLKRLQVCSVCGGYMRQFSAFPAAAGKRNWKDETFRRSFGGKQIEKFVCEKCGHTETFQTDDLAGLGEDE